MSELAMNGIVLQVLFTLERKVVIVLLSYSDILFI